MTPPDQPSASFKNPRVYLPFLVVTLIWGSTWIVIKDQISLVPPSWSVTYRFLLGGAVMLGVSLVMRTPLQIGRAGHQFAFLLGLAQFVFNFNFVYRAEHYITSGIVALIFALLFVPNALLARIFLGSRLSGRFIAGSGVAIVGLALLFWNEAQQNGVGGGDNLMWGLVLTLCGVLSASTANVMQATQRARSYPMTSMIGWAMIWGAAMDGVLAWAISGPPVIEIRAGYLLGVAYLGILASALTFTLYFQTIRDIGPARAAYSSVIIPVIAMAFSTAFEGYVWTTLAVLGSIVTLIGMMIALMPEKTA